MKSASLLSTPADHFELSRGKNGLEVLELLESLDELGLLKRGALERAFVVSSRCFVFLATTTHTGLQNRTQARTTTSGMRRRRGCGPSRQTQRKETLRGAFPPCFRRSRRRAAL